MVKWFNERGYKAIVGDSVTYDTPVYIKYPNGNIDIKAISELFSEESAVDFGNEQLRDLSEKPYQILTRNGWKNINYVYRHKTDKAIYHIQDDKMTVDVTEDHSLFDSKQNKIKPSEINEDTKLEYYENDIHTNIFHSDDDEFIKGFAERTNPMLRIPQMILNADKQTRSKYLYYLNELLTECKDEITCSKTFLAGYNFIQC